MAHDWMIKILEYLALYAAENRLPRLSAHLEVALMLAHVEIANLDNPSSSPGD